VIYSNWETSHKANDIASNPQASLAFWWKEVERQVRIEGTVERLSREEDQEYYDSRVRGSRIGAWASKQTQKIENRDILEERVKELEKKFEGQERIPCPEHWGGIRIVPDRIEFWQGRDSRLHDRFEYVKKEGEGEEGWEISRLSP
jgi:pyridoxamine 5'-phosphate oxidase